MQSPARVTQGARVKGGQQGGPNAGSWSTVPHVPLSPSHNYGESRWMQWTKGMVEGGGMQHEHEPRLRP